MTEPTTTEAITGLAEFFATSVRTPVMRRPDEYGMAYEDVFFPSLDGVQLEGWFIPADSNKLVICNHFMPGNRYGYPGHLEPWTNFGGFECNFLPQYKALHDAGYNVITYDMRNHGLSNIGNGGMVGIGQLEYRDVIGSLRYAKSRADTAAMDTALFSVCLGANSTIIAMDKHPEEFAHINSTILLQPISARPFIERAGVREGIGEEAAVEIFDSAIHKINGFHVDELSPIDYAKSVTVPALVVQTHKDFLTKESDVQTIFDNISSADKKLFWIETSDQRFQGYNYFSQNPQLMLEWFDAHFA